MIFRGTTRVSIFFTYILKVNWSIFRISCEYASEYKRKSVDQQSNKRTAYAVISQKVWCTCIPDNINQKKSSCFGSHSDTINIVNWVRHYTSFCTLYLLTSNVLLWFFDDWHSTLSFLLWYCVVICLPIF